MFAAGQGDADTIQFQEFTQLVSGYTLKGGQGNDTFTALGAGFGTNMSNSLVNGNAGNDTIDLALVSGSTIFGGQGDDTFLADLSNSVLNGNAGIDTINVFSSAGSSVFGGQGADVLSISGATSSSVIQGDLGNDRIALAGVTLTNSTVNGSDGEDTITVTGVFSGSSTTIYGGQGSDTLDASLAGVGSTGVVLSGDVGNDTISGTAFADNLFGGDGNDRITGGLLADTMTGGAGVNTFVFGVAAGTFGNLVTGAVDVITDFKAGAVGTGDVIDWGFTTAFTTQEAVNWAGVIADASVSAAGTYVFAVGATLGTSFTSYLVSVDGAGLIQGAIQLNGTGQYGTAALAQGAITAGQIV